jgi:hypothetical protein
MPTSGGPAGAPDRGANRSYGAARRPFRVELPERDRPAHGYVFTTVAIVVAFLVAALFSWAWLIEGKAVGVALVEIPLLMLLTTPLFVRAARTERTFDLGGILALGLLLRFAASYYRYLHAADAVVYHQFGMKLATDYRHLHFGTDPGAPFPGTGGMRIVAGVVEVFTNGNMYGTFLVFTWLGFLGCWFFYRAFATALPDCDRKRYALLVMLWPTMLYWPSSIGKDCWLIFGLGIASLGAARVLVRKPGGYTLLVLGTLLGSLVRPHVALLLAIAFAVALLVGRRADRPGALTPAAVGKVAGLVVVLALGGYLATRTADLLNAQDINTSVDSALTTNATRTDQGNSNFNGANPQNPVGYVQSAVTVLFRPFPFEAHGLESLATSAEALFLLGLAIASWRRLASIPRRIRPEPYVALALGFALMFFFAFGTISNFGILARERSQMMPYVFVLLSLTVVARQNRRGPRSSPASPRPTARESSRPSVRSSAALRRPTR